MKKLGNTRRRHSTIVDQIFESGLGKSRQNRRVCMRRRTNGNKVGMCRLNLCVPHWWNVSAFFAENIKYLQVDRVGFIQKPPSEPSSCRVLRMIPIADYQVAIPIENIMRSGARSSNGSNVAWGPVPYSVQTTLHEGQK